MYIRTEVLKIKNKKNHILSQAKEEERKRVDKTGKGERVTKGRKKAKSFLVSRIKTIKLYTNKLQSGPIHHFKQKPECLGQIFLFTDISHGV